ncbi:hypothetical protein [Thiohalophilus thiocyanatoxydans]|uniref:Uncharacterized protein n=1 Tax=Thiohalophilus thiocyanatoxydans TaxID=381308 RepID=A0A4R8IHG1_9GAMM|nr:hypothetical protein [Thiohalophilus thiocyanatoxydans]TDY00046.1 hypothetical protein EDC23_2207 [Thiohalophilus thiocyanatoxydans]
MIPKPVYELLPYFYLCVGVAAMLWLEGIMPFASGLLMSMTGVLVLWLRHHHRQSARLFPGQDWQAD